MGRINVTKTFLPPIEDYQALLDSIWERGQLTNQGPLLQEFEKEIVDRFSLSNFHFVSNGTIALQIALKALDITEGEIITTPFSYVATTSAILWERCKPVFVDIEEDTFCLDPNKIEQAITKDTKAILAVHVFGNPCDVKKIQEIAGRHKLKVIYDAAHAFGVTYQGRSLLSYGDISTCSFHSTKLFHTIEGGGIFTNKEDINEKLELIKRFGHNVDDHIMLGINAKANEFQAAMGLCNFKHLEEIKRKRKQVCDQYDALLKNKVKKPSKIIGTDPNYSYYPVVFKSEKDLLKAVSRLEANNIYARRYFYPSLNKLPYLEQSQECPISESVSVKILCLPLYPDLSPKNVERIAKLVAQ
jgi:dTDP-4-amino-4,6-dideoxygalactose transaminase